MFISIAQKSVPPSSSAFTISAIIPGSLPNICTAQGSDAGVVFKSDIVFLSRNPKPFALIISVTVSAQPCSRHISRYVRSVAPAMGARITGKKSPSSPYMAHSAFFGLVSVIIIYNV